MAKKRATAGKPALAKRAVPTVTTVRAVERADLWVCLVLLVSIAAVYAQVRHFDFVNIDDPDYVTSNAYVRQGVTAAGLAWALTTGEAANWFPVTRISHMLDVQFFGLNSGMHHLTNVFLHALASMLLYGFLRRATRARWPSAFVAFVFALHPLHVESVAWIAERKDVLSALFWMLALYAYLLYTERRGWQRYSLLLAVFALGLMSKPMVVTLPLVLLLLDFWPLRQTGTRSTGSLIWEKAPLFALSIAAAGVTWLTQRQGGAVKALSATPIGLRIENSLVSYLDYIGQTVWPAGMAAYYPYPEAIAFWRIGLAVLVLAGVSLLVVRSWRTRPYLAVGWLWYLVTLLPVIGLVQVGSQARADRYTYIPMVGVSIMLGWGMAELAERRPDIRRIVAAAAAAACLVLALLTGRQIPYWHDSETLFRHALALTERNSVAHNNLAMALSAIPGKLPEAIAEYQAALAIHPDHAEARNNLGAALARVPGRMDDAVREYEMALRIRPDYAEAHNNLGGTLLEMPGRMPDAISHLQQALRIRPDYEEARNNLGIAFSRTPGRTDDAIDQFHAALRLAPDDADAHYNLGVILGGSPGRQADAIAHFETALRLRPDYAPAQQWLDHLRGR